mgnify:CR=1 FL=1
MNITQIRLAQITQRALKMLLPGYNRPLILWGSMGRLTDMTETKIAITRDNTLF